MKRISLAVVLMLVIVACGDGGAVQVDQVQTTAASTTAVTATTTAPPTSEPVTTTAPAPRTHPFTIVSDDGEDVEVQAVCVTASAESPLDEVRIQDNFELDMTGLEVTARPGEDCNTDLHLSVNGHRKCGSYTGLGFCCPAYTIDASVTLRLDGILKKLLHFDRETNLLPQINQSMCHDRSDALAFPESLRDEIAVAMTDWFGLP